MSLKAQLTEAMKDAMRAREKDRLGAIRLILADIKRIEVDERIEVDDTRVLAILDKMCKQRKDSITQFAAAGRDDLVAQEQLELSVIGEFMPAQLSDAEVADIISVSLKELGISSMKDMGKAMAALKEKLQGRADMAQVSKQLKSLLSA
ncbi:MAG: GatB/YqeY domain-containing protein [Hahellaceae bacterium]|jgi:uncharacterized protein YqeY|nr:GatB/YqeY domain-containing protein [Hahellaceae bacterium]